jgi:hypothetical protein
MYEHKIKGKHMLTIVFCGCTPRSGGNVVYRTSSQVSCCSSCGELRSICRLTNDHCSLQAFRPGERDWGSRRRQRGGCIISSITSLIYHSQGGSLALSKGFVVRCGRPARSRMLKREREREREREMRMRRGLQICLQPLRRSWQEGKQCGREEICGEAIKHKA